MTTVGPQLVKDLRAQVTTLEKDLLARAQDVAEFAERLDAEYRAAREAERTAAPLRRPPHRRRPVRPPPTTRCGS